MTNKETLREEFYKFCFGARENGLIFDWFYSKLEEIRNEDKKMLVEILEDNRNETLWGNDESNETMKISIDNYIEAVKLDLIK